VKVKLVTWWFFLWIIHQYLRQCWRRFLYYW